MQGFFSEDYSCNALCQSAFTVANTLKYFTYLFYNVIPFKKNQNVTVTCCCKNAKLVKKN